MLRLVLSREGTSCRSLPVGVGVADDLSSAVDGAVGGLADRSRPAVAVEVVDHELGVMGTFADVLAEVDLQSIVPSNL